MIMKKLALFGGTGKTGSEFLPLALEAGYAVKALARNPAKMPLSHQNLEVIKGDVLNPKHVTQTIVGTDVVVSLFGHVKDSPAWLQTEGTRNIVSAMQTSHIKKIISLSGGGLPFPEKDQPAFADKMIRTIMKVVASKMLNDAISHHQVLADSGLDWVIVRGPRLTDQEKVGEYRVGWVGVNASTKIGRADLADFILTQVEDEAYSHQMPFVSY
jgi:putative NADH-flavin reductase